MLDVTVREFRAGDGRGVGRISLDNGAYYAALAPDYFKEPDVEGLAEMMKNNSDWRGVPTNLALVAEVSGNVAG